MNWTRERPTKPGYYWLQDHEGGYGIVHIGEVASGPRGERYLCRYYNTGIAGSATFTGEGDQAQWWWAGPIEPPSEV